MPTLLVSLIMGSHSDWPIMEEASRVLDHFKISHQARALSAHRTPHALADYIQSSEEAGVEIFIAAAGGAAHLPGVVASLTLLPVLGVPIPSSTFTNGLDALLSIVQMPRGVPVGTLAVGKAGAQNAALLAVRMLSNKYPIYKDLLLQYREDQTQKVLVQSQLKG